MSIFAAFADFLSRFDPLIALMIVTNGATGYLWWLDKKHWTAFQKEAAARFDAMVSEKDARHHETMATLNAAVEAANRQLADLNKDYSAANKDTSEIIAQVAATLATLAESISRG